MRCDWDRLCATRFGTANERLPFGLPEGAAACRAPSVCSSALRICWESLLGAFVAGYWFHEGQGIFMRRIRNPRKSPKAQSCSKSELFLEEEAEFRLL